ncbi:MAG: hypothetical protein R2712_05415 [Vicinamibacterales bacterium]
MLTTNAPVAAQAGAPRAGHPRSGCHAGRPQCGCSSAARGAVPTAADHNAVITKYCATCHNDRRPAAGLSLVGFDVATAVEHAEVAEKMIVKLQAGMMPPAGAQKPEPAAMAALITTLETTIDTAAAASPNPGRRVFQRLNRPGTSAPSARCWRST